MSVLAMILIGLAGGALPAALIGGFFTFRVNRATAVKIIAETSKAQEETRQIARNVAVIEAEKAILLADRRAEQAEKECTRCWTRVDEVVESLDAVIVAMSAIMARVEPNNGHDVTVTMTRNEIATVRAAVREARRHLN